MLAIERSQWHADQARRTAAVQPPPTCDDGQGPGRGIGSHLSSKSASPRRISSVSEAAQLRPMGVRLYSTPRIAKQPSIDRMASVPPEKGTSPHHPDRFPN